MCIRDRLSDIPLRVTFYARVSTDSDEQLNSLDNQIGYYRDYITRNPAWTFIDGYIDEGLSGIDVYKRQPTFQKTPSPPPPVSIFFRRMV